MEASNCKSPSSKESQTSNHPAFFSNRDMLSTLLQGLHEVSTAGSVRKKSTETSLVRGTGNSSKTEEERSTERNFSRKRERRDCRLNIAYQHLLSCLCCQPTTVKGIAKEGEICWKCVRGRCYTTKYKNNTRNRTQESETFGRSCVKSGNPGEAHAPRRLFNQHRFSY